MQVDGAAQPDDVQVVVELGGTNVWVTAVTPEGPRAPAGLAQEGGSGRLPATVRVGEDGTWHWGADRHTSGADVVLRGFLSRVEDDVPIVVGEEAVPAAMVVGRQLEHVLSVVRAETGPPSLVTVVHPDDLTAAGIRRVEAALAVDEPLRWVSRAAAGIAAGQRRSHLRDGDVVAALHVGGTSCVASVWSVAATPRRLGPARTEASCAGAAVDDAVLAHVRRAAGAGAQAGAPGRLRSTCREVKVALSGDTSTDLDVGGVRLRLVRTELEELAAPVLARQLDTLADALRLAGAEPSSLRTVLLTGGAAAAPSVVEGVGLRFDVPALVLGRLGETVEYDRAAGAAHAERLRAERVPAAAAGETRGLQGLLHGLAARVPVPPFAGPGAAWSRPARMPAAIAVSAVFALVLVATGAAVHQASIVSLLASALGSGEGATGLAARSLTTGLAGPLLSLVPKVPEQIRDAIEKTADTVTGGGDDEDAGGTQDAEDADPGAPARGGTTAGRPGASDPATTPGAPRATPPTAPVTGPGSTPSSPPTTGPAPAPSTAPSTTAPTEPSPDPTTTPPDPDPSPDPGPDPEPSPDPPPPDPDPIDPEPSEPAPDSSSEPPGQPAATADPGSEPATSPSPGGDAESQP